MKKSELKQIIREVLTEAEGQKSALDGKTKQNAIKFLYTKVEPITKGFFKDEYWTPVNKVWSVFSKELNLDWNLIDSKYTKDKDSGQDNGKQWRFEINMVDNGGKKKTINGTLNAHFAGSVKDPSDRYDISFIIA